MRHQMWIYSSVVLFGLATAAAADQVTTKTTTEEHTRVTTQEPAANPDVRPMDNVYSPEASEAPNSDQDLSGTVQSVDRRNRSLVLQDQGGKDIGITFNPSWHVYRRGEEIQYRDVEPNDHVVLRYRAES